MPLTIVHAKSLTLADGTTTNVVRPTDWNSGHVVTLSLDSTEVVRNFVAGGVTVSNGQLSFVNTNGFLWTMGTDGAVTLNKVATISRPVAFFGLAPLNTTTGTLVGSTTTNVSVSNSLCPLYVTDQIVGTNGIAGQLSFGVTGTTTSRTGGGTLSAGIFSYNGTNIVSMSTGTITFSISNTARSVSLTLGGISTSVSSAAGATVMLGMAIDFVEGAITLTPGTYWYGLAFSVTLNASVMLSLLAITNSVLVTRLAGTGAASSAFRYESAWSGTSSNFLSTLPAVSATMAVAAAVGFVF